ncbi:hypothetical protein HBE99_00825 [Mycobacteroides chelonae]|uniref:hypothetical protein n=1 Tax=Mycobacteroides chelonae TaxID=1774 RepID=UPI0019103824|nr:hypothetical protein [Mycobacteroides chelonae]QQG95593.1 hypothetical protein HBE99_00825 [Mycobacteroides chelonae]
MSISELGINRSLGSPTVAFECLCKMACREIAASKVPGQVVNSRVMAHLRDGGAEALVWMSGGQQVAIQAKAFESFENGETRDIKKSFGKLLETKVYDGVTHYLWCSTSDPNVDSRGEKINQTIAEMKTAAGARPMHIEFVGLGDIRGVLSADLHQIFFEQAAITAEAIRSHTRTGLNSARERVNGNGDTELHFESDLERVLETFTSHKAYDVLDVSHLRTLADEFEHRLRACAEGTPPGIAELATAIVDVVSELEATPADEVDVERLNDCVQSLAAAPGRIKDFLDAVRLGDDVPAWRRELLADVGVSAIALRYELTDLVTMVRALRSQILVVTGQWGTGKTYHLARHVEKLISGGSLPLFLLAKYFQEPGASLLMQSWKQQLGGTLLGPEGVLAVLDIYAAQSDSKAVLIAIDGLNEWPGDSRPLAELQNVAGLLYRYPHLKIVATVRSPAPIAECDLAQYHNWVPDRGYIARVLSEKFRLPLIAYWSGALRNPLTARIAAKVASARPEGMRSLLWPISFADLAQQWMDLLADEYARGHTQRSARSVTEIIAALTSAGGRASRRQLRDTVGGTEITDVIIDYLLDNGCFEEFKDEVTFRWQRMSEISQARLLVQSGPQHTAARLAQMAPEEQQNYLRLLADECVISGQPPAELPVWLNNSQDELLRYFARSLQSRASNRYTEHTATLARQAWESTQLSVFICYAALTNPLGSASTVSPGWLAEQLVQMAPAKRAAIWPAALDNCVEAEVSERLHSSDPNSGAISAVMTWISVAAHGWETPQQLGIARILLWFSWTEGRIYNLLYQYALRQLAELLHNAPQITESLISDCRHVRDEHLYEILTGATLAVLLRWPDDPASHVVARAVGDAMGVLRPQMLRTLEHLYRIEGHLNDQVPPFHEYLRQAENPWQCTLRDRIAARGRSPRILKPDLTAQYADGKTEHDYACEERALKRTCGPIGNAHRLEDVVTQRWRTHQSARYKLGGQVWDSERGPVKAGADHNEIIGWMRCGELPGGIDPTEPVVLSIDYDDEPRGQWWIVPKDPVTLADITVTDSGGIDWIVLNGMFRWLDPPSPPGGELIWLSKVGPHDTGDSDIGLPRPGQHRHHLLALSTTFHGPPCQGPVTDPDGVWWADELRVSYRIGASWDAIGSRDTSAPDAALANMLGATWTGHNLDYTCGGTLMITDPAVSERSGPRALLVRSAPFMQVLSARQITARIEIDIPDMHSLGIPRTPVRTIVIGGQDLTQPH